MQFSFGLFDMIISMIYMIVDFKSVFQEVHQSNIRTFKQNSNSQIYFVVASYFKILFFKINNGFSYSFILDLFSYIFHTRKSVVFNLYCFYVYDFLKRKKSGQTPLELWTIAFDPVLPRHPSFYFSHTLGTLYCLLRRWTSSPPLI